MKGEFLGAVWSIAIAACLAGPAFAGDVTEVELGVVELGRQVFQTGVGSGEIPITATLGGQTYQLPGDSLPCSSCHGPDGRGRPEGGTEPSNVTWPALTRPYEVDKPGGRRHPPYDRRLLIRAITLGIDPAGNELGIAMPRYQMSRTDAEALASYIEQLGEDRDPGFDDRSIRIGTLIPSEGRLAEAGRAVAAALEAFFEDVGGVYGRRLELVVAESGDSVDDQRQAVEELLAAGSVFAMLAPFSGGADAELAEVTDKAGVPVIGPLTQTPHVTAIPGRTFYLLSGLAEQARVLWDFAAGQVDGESNAAVVWTGEASFESAVESLLDQALRWQQSEPEVLFFRTGEFDPAAVTRAIREIDAVFFLGTGAEASRLVSELETGSENSPKIFVPGPLAGPLLSRTSESVYLAFPSLPDDGRPRAEVEWTRFVAKHGLKTDHSVLQRLAVTAANLLVDALRDSGRELTRDRVVENLETVYGEETDWTPPLTFGPNRRIGARGGWVVQADDRGGFVRAAGWIEPK